MLQLSRSALDTHYSLNKEIEIGGDVLFSTSLLNATIMEYLDLCQEALRKPDPGLGAFARENDEVIRSAGARLMISPAYAAVGIGEDLFGLFQDCNVISSLRYEGEQGTGTVLIDRKGHQNVEVALALTCPVRMTDYRAVRKLFETSWEAVSLLSDSDCAYGLGRTIEQYDRREEDLFFLRFTKHNAWELYHAESVMMQVIHGQPKWPEESISEQAFEECVKLLFLHLSVAEITLL